MDDITIARALHVLAVVHWIGGVTLVTLVILPAIPRMAEPAGRLPLFEAIEGRFSSQARLSVTLAGLTGFYMTHRLGAWDRFADPGFWWMHAMVLVWAVFTGMLFVAEPLFLHAWVRRRADRDPVGAFTFIRWAHAALLTVSLLTVGAAVLGAHGMLY
ncbi:MAG: hypothetical protein CMM50_11895 [Rhodospirillaceae bacterium]|nr:hypothetical protein [Rhodospirillaceae bacterium]